MISQSTAEHIACLTVLAAFFAANVFGIFGLWGLNLLTYVPIAWRIIGLTLIVFLLLPAASRRVMSWLEGSSQFVEEKKLVRPVMFGLAVLSCAFFGLTTAKTTLLGDGALRLNSILLGDWWLPTEAGDFLAHAALFRFALAPLGLSVEWTYRLLSIVSGMVFVTGSYVLSGRLSHRKRHLLFLVFVSSGCIVQFCGYVESYSILLGSLPWLLVAGIDALEGKRPSWLFAGLVVIAGAIHVLGLVVLLGSALCTLLIRSPRLAHLTRPRVQLGIAAAILAAGLVLTEWNFTGLSALLLPPFPDTDSPLAALSFRQATNVANWLFLSALPLVPLAVAALPGSGQSESTMGRQRFALSLAWPSVIFLLLFKPQLGAARDWDLFSVAGITLLAAAVIAAADRQHLNRKILPVVAAAVALTASFVAINSSSVRSLDRFADIIQIQPHKNLFNEYSLLYGHAANTKGAEDRCLNYALGMLAAPPESHLDSLWALNRIAKQYEAKGDTALVRTYTGLVFAIDEFEDDRAVRDTAYYHTLSSPDMVRRYVAMLEECYAFRPLALVNAGRIQWRLRHRERSLACFRRAYRLDSLNMSAGLYLGLTEVRVGNKARGVQLLSRLQRRNPDDFRPPYFLARAFLEAGDLDSSRYWLRIADPLAARPTQAGLLDDLRRQLTR